MIFVLAVLHGAMDIQERTAELEPTLITETELLRRSIFRDAPPDRPDS
ncbi:MAG: hypothetical protein LAT64_04150 [Phycisphaerales bacterium]|nr:hypothetical protein [Planctomycetota bacterium]MCH8507944.1 hypothetical protein [Phycisphaerales bacterium]